MRIALATDHRGRTAHCPALALIVASPFLIWGAATLIDGGPL